MEHLNASDISTETFLNDLHGENALIYFNVNGKTWKNKPQTYEEAKPKLVKLNQQQQDIYFIVNSGGTKNDDINKINACFIDWDCGKDEDGHYFPEDIVQNKKQSFLPLIHKFPLKPSCLIETRNGYHCYWLLQPDTPIDAYITLQKQLSAYFDSDPSVNKPAQVMRLPGYKWYKNKKNCSPFNVTIIDGNDLRYHYSDLLNALTSNMSSESINPTFINELERKSAHINTTSIYPIIAEAIIEGTYSQLNDSKIILNGMNEVIESIKRMNPMSYLGMTINKKNGIEIESKNILCPFHSDTTPSASIYKYTDGYYYLKCHSQDCLYGPGTIIDVVMKQKNCNVNEAIKVLMEYYHIEIDYTSWKLKQKETIEHNIEVIRNIGSYKTSHPHLYKMIHRIKEDLVSKLDFAKDHINLRTTRDELLIICSLRTFEKIRSYGCSIDGDAGRQNERIDRYCLLGLMRKLPDEEIPNTVLKNAYEQRRVIQKNKSGMNKTINMPRSQFYTIPEYTEELLQEADRIAQLIKSKGIRMNGISRDSVLDIFGGHKGKELYPQMHYENISKKGLEMRNKIEQIMLRDLQNNGYASIQSIVLEMQQECHWKSVTDRRVKKYLPGLLQQHDWVELHANNTLKMKYGIVSAGYPMIIIAKAHNEEKAGLIGAEIKNIPISA